MDSGLEAATEVHRVRAVDGEMTFNFFFPALATTIKGYLHNEHTTACTYRRIARIEVEES